MKRLLSVIVVLALIVVGVGLWRGWFSVDATGDTDPDPSARSYNIGVEIREDRIEEDLGRVEEAAEDIVGSTEEAVEEGAESVEDAVDENGEKPEETGADAEPQDP